jgi:hypothetical protein
MKNSTRIVLMIIFLLAGALPLQAAAEDAPPLALFFVVMAAFTIVAAIIGAFFGIMTSRR